MYGHYGNYGQTTVRECIRLGSSGDNVAALRIILEEEGFDDPSVSYFVSQPEVFESFDATLDSLVKQYQTSKGLTSDGIVGPNTWSSLGETGASCGSSRVGTYSSSGSGSSQLAPQTKQGFFVSDPSLPFYKQKWFI